MTSLFQINSRLNALMQARQEVLEEVTFKHDGSRAGLMQAIIQGEARQASIAEIDKAIRAYITEEVANNPDSIHQYFLENRARQEDIRAEIKRLDALLAGVEADEGRAKAIVLEILNTIGAKALPVRGTLRRQGNGGVQPVEVSQPELVPESLQRITITINLDLLRQVIQDVSQPVLNLLTNPAMYKQGVAEPDLTLIREALQRSQPCEACRGVGTITDIVSDSKGNVVNFQKPCEECGGKGSVAAGVPGCRLLDRGEHLRVS